MAFEINLVDYDNDSQQVTFETGTFGSATIDARETEALALENAIEAITLGQLYFSALAKPITDLDRTPPANGFAQKNIQWKLNYIRTGQAGNRSVKIGTADLSAPTVIIGGVPFLDSTAAVYTNLKTAFDALVRDEGFPVELQSVEYVE